MKILSVVCLSIYCLVFDGNNGHVDCQTSWLHQLWTPYRHDHSSQESLKIAVGANMAAAIVTSGIPDVGYVEHWQSVKSQSDNGTKNEALRNLNALLFEKDQDLCRYKEKYEQCEKVLKRTQQQLDNLLKKQYHQTSPSEPNVPCTVYGWQPPSAVAGPGGQTGQAVALRTVDAASVNIPAAVAEPKWPAEAGGTLTARGSARPPPPCSLDGHSLVATAEPTVAGFGHSSNAAAGARKVSLRDWSPGERAFDEVDEPTASVDYWTGSNGDDESSMALPLRHRQQQHQQQQQSLPASAAAGQFERHFVSLPATSSCSLGFAAGQPSLERLAAQPTVSTAVLRNLIKENLRMKKVIDEMRRREGGADTVNRLMDAAEADRAVTRLKQELHAKQKQVDDLQSALCSGGQGRSSSDSYQQSLAAKVAALETKVEKLNRSLEVKQRTILSLNESLQKVAGAEAVVKDNTSLELTDVEKLLKAIDKLQKEHREETELLNTQLQIYRDDFEAERVEKKRLCEDYDSRLAKLTAQISLLKTQLQAANQEVHQYRTKGSLSNRPAVTDMWSAQYSSSTQRSSGPAQSPSYCFSVTSPVPTNSYNCPQCHVAFGTQASFQSHTDVCLRHTK